MRERSPDIEAEVIFLAPEQGGRSSPAFSRYQPHHRNPRTGLQTSGEHVYENEAPVLAAKATRATIRFSTPETFERDLRIGDIIEAREGDRVVAHVRVLEILNPLLEAPTVELSPWEQLLGAERHLQHLLPGTILVGGTAAGLHLAHRRSLDGDHVLATLKDRYDEVLAALESAAGWTTARVVRPVLILGALDGFPTGIRQLRRAAPLHTEMIEGLRVPTLAEMARIKAWLLATRHTVRDYLDTTALLERLQEAGAPPALATLDELYPQGSGTSVLAEVVERLAAGAPGDLAQVDLSTYRGLVSPWNDWSYVRQRGSRWASILARALLTSDTEHPETT